MDTYEIEIVKDELVNHHHLGTVETISLHVLVVIVGNNLELREDVNEFGLLWQIQT
jgi:hypothetical protein